VLRHPQFLFPYSSLPNTTMFFPSQLLLFFLVASFATGIVASDEALTKPHACSGSTCSRNLAADTVGGEDTEAPEPLFLLQTAMHVAAPAQLRPSDVAPTTLLPKDRAAAKVLPSEKSYSSLHDVQFLELAQNYSTDHGEGRTVSFECSQWSQFTPLETQLGMETLRFIGYLPKRTVCAQHDAYDALRVHHQSLVAVRQADTTVRQPGTTVQTIVDEGSVSIFEQLADLHAVVYVLIIFFAVVANFIGSMLWTVFQKAPPARTKEGKGPHRPEADSWKEGWLSWLTISWATPWIQHWGNTSSETVTKIKEEELGAHGDEGDETSRSSVEFARIWEQDLKTRGTEKMNLYYVIFKFCGWKNIVTVTASTAGFHILLFLGPPFAVDWILNYLAFLDDQRKVGTVDGETVLFPTIVIVVLLTAMPCLMAMCNTITFLTGSRLNVRLQGALIALIYKKAQRLPSYDTSYNLQDNTQKEEIEKKNTPANTPGAPPPAATTSGEKYNLVQLINKDVGAQLANLQLNISKAIVLLPILITLCVLLTMRIGKASIVTVLSLLVLLFVVWILIRMYVYHLRAAQVCSSRRLAKFQEMLFGIRIIKSYAWEDAQKTALHKLRNDELHHLRLYMIWHVCMFLLFYFYPRIVIGSSLSAYVWMYGDISAADIFVLFQLLNAFKGVSNTLLATIPSVFALGPSIRRLDLFLKLKEANIPGPKEECKEAWVSVWPAPPSTGGTSPSLRVQGSFSWQEGGKPALHDIDLTFQKGELVAIVGETGCGKTTLLHAMLGELAPLDDARIEIPRLMAYHAQVPSIFEGTLKENVLYSSACHEQRYEKAIFAAGLEKDIELLGHSCPIGSRGISLSGGQRARVSMARAAYSLDSDLVLLDDPFSSVDAHTGRHLLDHLLLGALMRDRTRVVVCQPDTDRITNFDRVVIVSGGRIVAQGPPSDVVKLSEYRALLSSNDEVNASAVATTEARGLANAPGDSTARSQVKEKETLELRDDESEGRANWETIRYFGSLAHWMLCVGSQLFMFGLVVCQLCADLVLADWANKLTWYDSVQSVVGRFLVHSPNPWVFIRGYCFWMSLGFLIFGISWQFGIAWSLNVSRNLHNNLLDRLLRAPIDKFYDKTPVGRIMNRMSTDLSQIDYELLFKLQSSFGQFWFFVVPIVYIHVVMPLFFTVLCIPFYVLLVCLVKRYWNIVVPLRYLTQVTRSRVNAFITDAEASNLTVRAYQVAEELSQKQMLAVDAMIKADFAAAAAKRWILNRLLVMFSFLCTGVALVAVLCPGSLEVGTASLCIANVIFCIMGVEQQLDFLTAVQFQFVSMNRVHEYTSLVQERAEELQGDRKYQSFNVPLTRAELNGLEAWEPKTRSDILGLDNATGLVVARMKSSWGPCTCQSCSMCLSRVSTKTPKVDRRQDPHELILRGSENGQALLAEEGQTLDALAPRCKGLYDLHPWHRITAANDAVRDSRLIASELCYGDSARVMVKIESDWLRGGPRIEIRGLEAGYGDAKTNVLKGVNLTIERNCKVAIAGTTGCGKSTLLLCLLRILERRAGTIKIEGVNIEEVGLKTLRRAVGLVPQDPVVFSGTIRANLDPFDEYTDNALWRVLADVKLDAFVQESEAGLLCPVKQDGENLSFGQRQLLCIARMILRQPALLLLDEATSAIDPATQELVQNSIRKSFPDSTVIAVAHRLETVMDFDVMVVMDKGVVAEVGAPQELRKSGGYLARMLGA
jgi:ABC-type multidrug transport system fused ATPase/permease subunit